MVLAKKRLRTSNYLLGHPKSLPSLVFLTSSSSSSSCLSGLAIEGKRICVGDLKKT